MAEPQRSHEPTMEEILASIRRIISDDDDHDSGDAAAGAGDDRESPDSPDSPDAPPGDGEEVDADMAAMAADAESEIVAGEEAEGETDDVLELTDDMAAPADEEGEAASDDLDALLSSFDEADTHDDAAPAAEEEAGDIAFEDIAPEPESGPPPSSAPDAEEPDRADRPLLSSDAQAAASAAFGALASSMLAHSGGARTLEQITEDLLRPLLKGWLDENLPPLVERLVREEIERVARRSR